MPNYKESILSGSAWVRANRVILDNPYGQIASIRFEEEQIFATSDGDSISKPYGACQEFMTPESASTEFDITHPVTGDVLGKSTYQEVYVLMSSLYVHLAKKRDEIATQRETERLAWVAANPPAPT